VAEQVALYGTLTGEGAPKRAPVEPEGEGAEIVHMPTRRSGQGRARGK
jgi:hypothetical protein